MFQNITTNYNGMSALLEVLTIIAISFALGYLLHYLLTKRLLSSDVLEDERDEVAAVSRLPEKHEVVYDEADAEELLENVTEEPSPLSEPTEERPRIDTGRMVAVLGKTYAFDDLKLVEGIGPAIEKHLKHAGIETWADLASADLDRLRSILDDAGPNYRIHNPKTWPDQASLARDGKWDELKEFQDFLSGGV